MDKKHIKTKGKPFIPENIEDLEKMYYGENKDGTNIKYDLIKKHQTWLKTNTFSPLNEKEIVEIFSPLGKVVKIKEIPNQKTFDFKIDEEKILTEVTSLDFMVDAKITITENKIIYKMQKAIGHIVEKDTKGFQDYYKGGVIFYTILFDFFSKIRDLIHNVKFLETAEIFKNNLDFLVFLPERASINNKSSRKTQPPVFYVKNQDLFELFKRKFHDKNYKINFISRQ